MAFKITCLLLALAVVSYGYPHHFEGNGDKNHIRGDHGVHGDFGPGHEGAGHVGPEQGSFGSRHSGYGAPGLLGPGGFNLGHLEPKKIVNGLMRLGELGSDSPWAREFGSRPFTHDGFGPNDRFGSDHFRSGGFGSNYFGPEEFGSNHFNSGGFGYRHAELDPFFSDNLSVGHYNTRHIDFDHFGHEHIGSHVSRPGSNSAFPEEFGVGDHGFNGFPPQNGHGGYGMGFRF